MEGNLIIWSTIWRLVLVNQGLNKIEFFLNFLFESLGWLNFFLKPNTKECALFLFAPFQWQKK
jgi:hypothetical protein